MQRRSFLALALPPALAGATPITGRWRSVATTRGGIGAVYDFLPNGGATYSSAAIVDMPFQQDGNQIVMDGKPIGFGWHADGRLQLNYGNNDVADFVRRGKVLDPANPLLGEWQGHRVMQGRALPLTLQFRADHSALFVILLKTQAGRYQQSGPAWTLKLPALPPRTITAAADQLTITATGGDPHQFSRF